MSYKIIISRYNESIEWTYKMNRENLVIYNKGADIIDGAFPRENVGREADTFFHYIIEHYDRSIL